MATLENKCTLISMFDALAYQYPYILHIHDVSTPLELVQLMLEGKASKWDLWDMSKKIKQRMIDGGDGCSLVFLVTCYYFNINMCGKRMPLTRTAKEKLSTLTRASRPMLLNICEDGPQHVEFFPFSYVRTKRDQELYEKYSESSRIQIKEYEHKKYIEEEMRASENWLNVDMGWGDELYQAGMKDLEEFLKT